MTWSMREIWFEMCKFAFWALGFVLAFIVTVTTLMSARISAQLYEFASFSVQTDTAFRSALELLSFRLYRGGSLRQEEMQGLADRLSLFISYSQIASLLFVLLTLVFLAFLVRRLRQGQRVTRALIWFSALLLLPGLFAPMLSVTFFQDLPVLGSFVLDYHSQGILESIASLFTEGYWFVALVLFLFSVVTPITKVISLVLVTHPSNTKQLVLIDKIAKWSMLDVLVVAVLISVFVLGASSFSSATPGTGLYFFTAYCVLSLISTQLVQRELSTKAVQPFLWLPSNISASRDDA